MSKIGTAPDPARLAERAIEDGGEDMDDLEAFVETVHGDTLRVHYAERGADHITQESALRRRLDDWLHATIAIDAVGEGSGLGDRLQQAYPDVHRFKAGQTTEFKDCGRRPFTRSEVGFATVVSSTTTTSVRNYSWRHGL